AITEYPTPTPNSFPAGIAAGPDGNLWFTEYGANQIGVISPPPVVLKSVSTQDSNELTVNYSISADIHSKTVHSLQIAIFRSDKPTYDPTAKNLEVASYQLMDNQLNRASGHSITINSSNGSLGMNSDKIVAPLAPDPALPYVLAVADPQKQLPPGLTI